MARVKFSQELEVKEAEYGQYRKKSLLRPASMPKHSHHEYNVFWTMQPVFLVCKLLGLSYIYVSDEKRKTRKFGSFQASIVCLFSFAYSLSFLVLQGWFYVYWYRVTVKDGWTPTLEARIRFVTQLLYSVLCLVNSSYSVALTKRVNELMCDIDRFDNRLKGVRRFCKDQRLKLTYMLILLIAVSVVGQVKLFQMRHNQTIPMLFLSTVLSAMRISIIPLIGMQFVGLVGLIRRRIIFINRALSFLGKSEAKTLSRKGIKHSDERKFFFNSESSIESLRFIRLLRKDLTTISHSINQAFGFILFCTVITTLMLTSVVTFLLLLELTNPTTGVSKIVHLGARCLCVLIGCIVMVYESAVTTKESERTTNILHKALLNNPMEDMMYELNQFIHQLLLEKVSFSAWKLFPIDQRLLYSMNGTVVTSFIVLVQMKVSEIHTKKHQDLEQ